MTIDRFLQLAFLLAGIVYFVVLTAHYWGEW